MDGLRYAVFADRHLGCVNVLYPIPLPQNPWGVLSPLQETPWAEEIPTITKEAVDHALHGYLRPFLQQIGSDPLQRSRRLARTLKPEHLWCLDGQTRMCDHPGPDCRLGTEKVPACYVAPFDLPQATAVAKAWAENRYVFVVGERNA